MRRGTMVQDTRTGLRGVVIFVGEEFAEVQCPIGTIELVFKDEYEFWVEVK